MQYQLIAIKDIITDGTQMRDADADRIADNIARYTEALAEFEQSQAEGSDPNASPFPPLDTFVDADFGTHYLGDGHQRLKAYLRRGRKAVMCRVHSPEEMDGETDAHRAAKLFAAQANAEHGALRSPQAATAAVRMLLLDADWVQWSDREIARRCKVSHAKVGRIRKEMEEAGEIEPVSDRIVERSGSTFLQAPKEEEDAPPEPGASGSVIQIEQDDDQDSEPGQEDTGEDGTGRDDAAASQWCEDSGETRCTPQHTLPTPPPERVHEDRIRLHNEPYQEMITAVRSCLAKIQRDFRHAKESQFPQATYYAIEAAANQLVAACKARVAAGVCPQCGGSGEGCAACRGNGWLNSERKAELERTAV